MTMRAMYRSPFARAASPAMGERTDAAHPVTGFLRGGTTARATSSARPEDATRVRFSYREDSAGSLHRILPMSTQPVSTRSFRRAGPQERLRIAHIAPLYEAVPPRLYGGTERIVAYLADALVDLGHDVTLFASAETRTRARLVPVRDQAIRLDPSPLKSDLAAHLAMLHDVRQHALEFDILHFHVDLMHFPFFESLAHRTVTTLHGRLDLKDLPGAYRCWPQYPLISVSDRQRLALPEAN